MAGSRALKWGSSLAIIGVVLVIIGSSTQSDGGTKSELLGGGLMMGIGGWLLIVGIITLIVGFVGRSRANKGA